MKLSIIRNLAVAALLSTTLISGAMAATIDATELDLTTGDVGKALAPLLARPEGATLKAEVEKAINAGSALHSGLAKPALLDLIAKYEAGLATKKGALRENYWASEGLDPADISKLLVGKTAAQIEAEAVDHHWAAFLASETGKRLAAKGDAEVKFGAAAGTKASAFLAAKPTKLADVQAVTKDAEDYYAPDASLKRNIGEITSLKAKLAVSSISVSDVDTLLAGLGVNVADLGLAATSDGKAYLKAAFAAIKGEGSAFEAALAKNTVTMKQLRSDIAAAAFAPPPPSASPKGSPTSSRKRAPSYSPADFNGLPLLSLADFGSLSEEQKTAFQTAFAKMPAEKQEAYQKMAEPTHTGPIHGSVLHFANERDAQDAHDRGEISAQQLRELSNHRGW